MQRWILFAAFVAACSGGGDEPDTEARTAQCERAREHVIDLRLAGAEALGTIELEKHRAALTTALGSQFMDNCRNRLSDEHVACLLVAADSEDINGCNTAARGQ
jgi:hypothetical protein